VAAAGHVEKGEDPEKSIKREAFEELGLKIKPVFFTKVLQRRDNKETRFFWVYYSVLKELPKLKLDRSEVSDARWVKIGDLEEFAEDNYYNLDGLSHKLITELSQHLKI
jgi:8-oxo-dGTP pyrophosphatase MutT (NUDIX family)